MGGREGPKKKEVKVKLGQSVGGTKKNVATKKWGKKRVVCP